MMKYLDSVAMYAVVNKSHEYIYLSASAAATANITSLDFKHIFFPAEVSNRAKWEKEKWFNTEYEFKELSLEEREALSTSPAGKRLLKWQELACKDKLFCSVYNDLPVKWDFSENKVVQSWCNASCDKLTFSDVAFECDLESFKKEADGILPGMTVCEMMPEEKFAFWLKYFRSERYLMFEELVEFGAFEFYYDDSLDVKAFVDVNRKIVNVICHHLCSDISITVLATYLECSLSKKVDFYQRVVSFFSLLKSSTAEKRENTLFEIYTLEQETKKQYGNVRYKHTNCHKVENKQFSLKIGRSDREDILHLLEIFCEGISVDLSQNILREVARETLSKDWGPGKNGMLDVSFSNKEAMMALWIIQQSSVSSLSELGELLYAHVEKLEKEERISLGKESTKQKVKII